MKNKKIPQRLCVGCGQMQEKRNLTRIVKSPEGEISLDPTGKKAGRGAYICKNMDCLKKAQKGHKLERSFSCQIGAEVYEGLENELQRTLVESADHLS